MNISEAKEFIKDTVKIYLMKDEYGEYKITTEKQRPLFLYGTPGIGKTAIVSQVAKEMKINLVQYSMTHHTRQSALGLPYIVSKEYGQNKTSVTEYTMSEIISTIYDEMEKTKITEGILFLDEINCVSETLTPAILQFLQFKTFGKHSIPSGWIVVTAGNPPEYNKSAREFDIVTMDRLKVLDIDADYEAWKKYAIKSKIHPIITAFLDDNLDYFYMVSTNVGKKNYVTARGWDDLSTAIKLYEENNMAVSFNLIKQYVRDDNIASKFEAYYKVFDEYRRVYHIDELLSGNINEANILELSSKNDDAKRTFIKLLCVKLDEEMEEIIEDSNLLYNIIPELKIVKEAAREAAFDIKIYDGKAYVQNAVSSVISNATDKRKERYFKGLADSIAKAEEGNMQDVLDRIDACFDAEKCKLMFGTDKEELRLHNAFEVIRKIGAEDDILGDKLMAQFVIELSARQYVSYFISRFGSKDYDKYSSLAMVSESGNDIRNYIKNNFNDEEN